jgi:hypothetical protein
MKTGPKYVLDADIRKSCYDNLKHKKMLKMVRTYPKMERQIKK